MPQPRTRCWNEDLQRAQAVLCSWCKRLAKGGVVQQLVHAPLGRVWLHMWVRPRGHAGAVALSICLHGGLNKTLEVRLTALVTHPPCPPRVHRPHLQTNACFPLGSATSHTQHTCEEPGEHIVRQLQLLGLLCFRVVRRLAVGGMRSQMGQSGRFTSVQRADTCLGTPRSQANTLDT